MTEEELQSYWGKTVKVACKDNDILEGVVAYFASSYDNEPDEASITIESEKRLGRNVVVSLSEIETIEVIN